MGGVEIKRTKKWGIVPLEPPSLRDPKSGQDANLCPSCGRRRPLEEWRCSACQSQIIADQTGSVSLWQLGNLDSSFLKSLGDAVEVSLGCPVVVQRTFIDDHLSDRPTWVGRSARVILNQMERRSQPGGLFDCCIVAETIASAKSEEALLGMTYPGWAQGVVSLALIKSGSQELLVKRASKLLLNQMGAAAGLAEHPPKNGDPCCMSIVNLSKFLEQIDRQPSKYCPACLAVVQAWLQITINPPMAGRPAEATSERVGYKFAGRFTLKAKLGEGGEGAIWEAFDEKLQTRVAIKFHLVNNDQHLRDEVIRARHLNHPNIIKVFDFVEAAGRFAMIMEFVKGKTLQSLLKDQEFECFEPAEIRRWMLNLCDAVETAHRQGIIHRDIKPMNCMVDAEGRLRLLDFGLSRSFIRQENVKTRGDVVGGTPGFTDPAVFLDNQPPAPSDDVFSIGAMMFALLTGAAPGFREQSVNARRKSFSRKPPNLIPLGWERMIKSCLQERASRPQSVAQVSKMLRQLDPDRSGVIIGAVLVILLGLGIWHIIEKVFFR